MANHCSSAEEDYSESSDVDSTGESESIKSTRRRIPTSRYLLNNASGVSLSASTLKSKFKFLIFVLDTSPQIKGASWSLDAIDLEGTRAELHVI